MDKKMIWIIVIVVVVVVVLFYVWPGVLLSPTDVSVTVNADPIITSIIVDGDSSPLDFLAPLDVELLAATTKTVNVRFIADDADNNLNDGSATAQLSRGGVDRPAVPATCTTYECSTTFASGIDMEYFDDAASDWIVAVFIQDSFSAVVTDGSDTSTFTVTELKDIFLSAGSPIIFGTVSPGQLDVEPADTSVTNRGNYVGTIDVTAFDLEEASLTDTITVGSFVAAGSAEVVSVCLNGDLLGPEGSPVTITDSSLPKDTTPGEGLTEEIQWCMDVPGGIVSGLYDTTTGGSLAWTIEI